MARSVGAGRQLWFPEADFPEDVTPARHLAAVPELPRETPFTTADLAELARAESWAHTWTEPHAVTEPYTVTEPRVTLEPGVTAEPRVITEDLSAEAAPAPYKHQQVERRRAAHSRRREPAHRGATRPVATLIWLAVATGLGLGILMLQRPRALGMQVAGFLLLLAMMPVTVVVVARAVRRGFGSKAAVAVTGFFLALALLRLSYFL